ncbi:MAG: O-antigen ligase family protein [Actinomycetota bacterium]
MRTLLLEKGPIVRRGVLLALVAGVPVVFLRSTNSPFNVPKIVFLLIGVSVVAALRIAEIIQGAPADGLKRLWVPAAAIAVPLTIAWAASSYRGWALLGLYGRFQGLIPYLMVVALGVLIADAFAGRTSSLAWAVVAGGAVMGGYALVQWLGADPYDWNIGGGSAAEIALSTTGNPNFTGGYLGVVLPVAVGVLWLDGKHRIHAAVCVALIVTGLYAADSQGGWGAGLAGTALVAGFFLAPRWRYARHAGAAVAGLVVVAAVVTVVVAVAAPDNGVTSETVRWRGWWWQAAAGMAGDSPIWGHGPNVFAYEGVHYRVADEAATLTYNFADDPHSVFMSFLANAGGQGALGFLVLMAWVVLTGAHLSGSRTWAVVWLGAAAAYFAQALVSIDELTLRLGLWTAVGGLAAATIELPGQAHGRRGTGRRRRPRKEPLKAWPAVVALSLAMLGVTWWGINALIADGRVLDGQTLFARGRPEEARREFDRALDFRSDNVYRQNYGFQLGQVALARRPEGRDYLELSSDAYAFVDDFPDIGAIVSYARILHGYAAAVPDLPQLDERALDLYKRAIAHDPLNPLTRVEASDVLNGIGRPQEAIDILEPATETGSRYAQWWGALSVARALLGDTAAAQEAIDRAFALYPGEGHAVQAQEILSGP